MKLARTAFVVIRNDGPAPGPVVRAVIPRQQPGRLVAKWRMRPGTERLECIWSLEQPASDEQLCVGSQYRLRAAGPPLSQICNRAA